MKFPRQIVLVLVPLLFFFGAKFFAFAPEANPTYSDPGYYYLLNFYRVAIAEPPAYFHHPGIPIQWLGGALVLFKYWLWPQSSGGMVEDFTRSPEHYLDFCGTVVLGLNALALFFLGISAWRRGLNVFLALFVQVLCLAASPQIWKYGALVHPEGFGIMLGIYLGIFLTSQSTGGRIAYTVLTGVALATKLFYVPFLLGNFFVWGVKRGFLGVLGSLGIFFAFLFSLDSRMWEPALRNYWQISIHSGPHENGEIGFITGQEILKLLKSYLESDVTMFVTIGLILLLPAVGIAFLVREKRQVLKAPLTAMYVLALASLLVFLRKPYKDYYLIPTLGVLPHLFREYAFSLRKKMQVGIGFAIILGAFAVSIEHYKTWIVMFKNWGEQTASESSRVDAILKDHLHCYQFIAGGVVNRYHAMAVGHLAAIRAWREPLRKFYNDRVYVQTSPGRYAKIADHPDGQPISEILKSIPRSNCVLFLSANTEEDDAKRFLASGKILFDGTHKLYYQRDLRGR